MLIRIRYLIAALCVSFVSLSSTDAQAESVHKPQYQANIYDLANAVNALRAAYGLPPYGINPILMFTAQNQADFMASTGQVTHSGPGGSTFTQRLLAAGYPLDGDLSLGGFRAENITSGNESMSAQSAVDAWMGDALHQNTMLSANLTEIGAGVAIANGHVYLVIDCARPTNAPPAPEVTSVVENGTGLPAGEAPIWPVILSTPNANGEVVHEVQYGQTLWQLAISYGVKIDEIKQLNGLSDNSLYPGDKLLIKIELTPTVAPPTASIFPTMTLAPTDTVTATPILVPSETVTPVVFAEQNSRTVMTWAIGIIALAIFGAGAFAWLGSKAVASKSR